jgi:hypothetical protein
MTVDRTGITQPGPPAIDPDLAPGGIVFHAYAVPTERLLNIRHISQSDVERDGWDLVRQAAIDDADNAALELRVDELAVCLVMYDGDTGERIAPEDYA